MPVYRLTINGTARDVETAEQTLLLDLLRDTLGLTGTKYGCGEGQCGACTVLVAGKPVKACLTTASQVAGQPVETIEALASPQQLHPIQDAFLSHAAFQCGFCTPGMIMAVKALLTETASPSTEQIEERLEGHICRCGTHPRIVEAVKTAAKKIRAANSAEEGNRRA
ncbi:MAG: (2Fe-2S)-binding protein [Bryobacterales bacterium]|nr:(2Fe-2S)-binding protein [Bryobacterales bacterium]